jgi:hypothetical protein
MDDYCWIHSTFHVRYEYQGNVGCILDNVLTGRDSILLAAADTPDTAFYQWVPFTLVFQVSNRFTRPMMALKKGQILRRDAHLFRTLNSFKGPNDPLVGNLRTKKHHYKQKHFKNESKVFVLNFFCWPFKFLWEFFSH